MMSPKNLFFFFHFITIFCFDSSQKEKLEIFSLGGGKNLLHFSFQFEENVDLSKITFNRKNWERSIFEVLIEKSNITDFKVHLSNGQLNTFFKQNYSFPFDLPESGAKIFLSPDVDYTSAIHSISEIFGFEKKIVLQQNYFLVDLKHLKSENNMDSMNNNNFFLPKFIFANSPDDFICVETFEKIKYYLGCSGSKGLFSLLDLSKIFQSEYISIAGDFHYESITKKVNYGIEINLLIDYDLKDKYFDTNNLEACLAYNESKIISYQIKDGNSPIFFDLLESRVLPFAYIPFIQNRRDQNILGMNPTHLKVNKFFTQPVYSFENDIVYEFQTYENNVNVVLYEYLPYYFSAKIYKITGYLNFIKHSVEFTYEVLKNHVVKAFLIKFIIKIPKKSRFSLKIPLQKLMKSFENYPHDAARGLPLIGTPIIYYINNETNFRIQNTQNLLLRLPEPDFSMPFNISTYTFVLLGYFYLMVFKIVMGKLNNHWSSEQKESKIKRILNFFRIKL